MEADRRRFPTSFQYLDSFLRAPSESEMSPEPLALSHAQPTVSPLCFEIGTGVCIHCPLHLSLVPAAACVFSSALRGNPTLPRHGAKETRGPFFVLRTHGRVSGTGGVDSAQDPLES